MGRVAFVFSGQGDQHPGMGKELFDKFTVAKEVFALCDELRQGTLKQCFEGTDEELKETKNTQPALFAMELAAAKVLISREIKPEAVAGFSLGEVVAATVSGKFDEKTGFSLVCKRGELMQEAAENKDTSMAAVVKLTQEQVETLCEKYTQVYPVNYNCPGQISVAGAASQMQEFSKDVKAAGGRALPLKVKGAFHSPFMKEAMEGFLEELKKQSHAINTGGEITLYSNVTAKPYTEDVIGLLSRQIASPVKWEQLIKNMISDGFDTFIEIGPGKTLTNMIKKIDDKVKAESYLAYLEDEGEKLC